jgi:hypothetical protein
MQTVRRVEDLPLVLSIREMGDLLNLGKNQAYQLAHSAGLAVSVGKRRYVVPRDRLVEFLKSA